MPHPEDTLERLAELAREEEAWEAALERRSLAQSRPGDEELVDSLPAFASEPLSSERTTALIDSIQARLQQDGEQNPPPSASVEASAQSPQWPRRVWVASAALSAIAAGALLWLRTPAEVEPLSPYEVHVRGSQRSNRAGAPTPTALRLRPRSELHFELRPRTDVRGDVRARIFVDPADASGSFELRTTSEQSEAGALRIRVNVPSNLPESGELLLFVGRSRSIEDLLPTGATSAASGALQQFRWRFERTPVAP